MTVTCISCGAVKRFMNRKYLHSDSLKQRVITEDLAKDCCTK